MARFSAILLMIFFTACKKSTQLLPAFTLLEAEFTGLHFNNKLTATPKFNMFNYMYFYNGAGVAAGDFNNDGKTDLFFCSNQGQNTLFLNQGNLQFRDVTAAAGIPDDGGWSTGVSVVDINSDGLLDIYVCRVGQYEVLKGSNQFLICKGIKDGVPYYTDEAESMGLNFSGFSTQAAFFDYDLDGDLDLYLMNHSVHHNGSFAARLKFLGSTDSLSGDRFYKNENGKFIDHTSETGINTSAIGYGLGICIADINLDGWPDIYIGNDFHENDYLYINQKNGSFREEIEEQLMHTSQFSMGVDVADVNNDAYPEIISMDMLPDDPYILKRSLGEDEYETFFMKIRYGYNYQYARNTLQFNRGNDVFSETGLYSGVSATDWSWSPLWVDFNNDGLKDLFVSNGIPKRLNDIDYVNYVSNDEVQAKINSGKIDEKEMAIIDKFPQIKLPNKFYYNQGELKFSETGNVIENNKETFSNGAVYADLDNDGDLDIVVNNIDDEAMVYRNNFVRKDSNYSFQLNLVGDSLNRNAVGATVLVFSGGERFRFEKYPVKGFQSSMEVPLPISFGRKTADSILLIWPNGSYQHIEGGDKTVAYRKGLPQFNFSSLKRTNNNLPLAENITASTGINYLHRENRFNEFNREQLLPQMLSTEGPALAIGDLDGNGLEDIFIGSSKGYKPVIFMQQKGGKFSRGNQPQLDADSLLEEVDAEFADFNGDGFIDLAIATGGNEFYGSDQKRLPRLLLNDGKGNLVKKEDAFPQNMLLTASTIAVTDFTGDGVDDIFIGARTTVWNYGKPPQNYLLKNDGKGRFTDVTEEYMVEFKKMVTGAEWADMNGDGKKDLVVAVDWGPIEIYLQHSGKFQKLVMNSGNGWWRFASPTDVDGDGDLDIIAGNLGLNSRLKASVHEPVKMYYNDFDGNSKYEQVITYYLHGRELPFANKAELEKQMPAMKKKFLYAEDLAKASIDDVFPKSLRNQSITYSANNFANTIFINDGHMNFTAQPLPWTAQLSPFNTVATVKSGNHPPYFFLGGNFYENNIQMGRYDADYGTMLWHDPEKKIIADKLNGLNIKGQVSKILPLKVNGQDCYVVARNNDSLMVIKFANAAGKN